MKAADLIRIGQKLWGDSGWMIAMAASLGVDISTVRRWIAANHVPGPASLALKFLEKEHDWNEKNTRWK